MPPGTDLVVVFPVPAAVFQENDIGEIALVVGDESLERACITRAGVNDAVGSLWDGTQVSLRLIIPINGGAVEDPLALVRTYWSRYPAETTLPPGAVISGLSVRSGDTPQEEVG